MQVVRVVDYVSKWIQEVLVRSEVYFVRLNSVHFVVDVFEVVCRLC